MHFGKISILTGLAAATLILVVPQRASADPHAMDSLLQLQHQNDSIHNALVDPKWKRDLKQKDWDYQSRNLDFESRKVVLEQQRTELAIQQQRIQLRQQAMENQTRIAKGQERALSNGNVKLRDYSLSVDSDRLP